MPDISICPACGAKGTRGIGCHCWECGRKGERIYTVSLTLLGKRREERTAYVCSTKCEQAILDAWHAVRKTQQTTL